MAKLIDESKRDNLPASSNRGVPAIAMELHGDNNTQVGYAEKVVNNTIIVAGTGAGAERTRQAMNGRHYSNDYYHLFCIGIEDYSKDYFMVDASRAFTECIAPDLREKYERLNTPEIIDELMSFPALFTSENHSYGSTDETHTAYFGLVTGIKVRENGIQVYFQALTHFPQQRLNELSQELGFNRKYFTNELNRTHWTIKRIDLVETLHDAYLPVQKLN